METRMFLVFYFHVVGSFMANIIIRVLIWEPYKQ